MGKVDLEEYPKLISFRRKFIFIHIGKNGGKSVEKALRPFSLTRTQRFIKYIDTRTFKRDPYRERLAGSHPSVADLKAVLGEDVFNEFYSFCFVRNPWSRMLSFYSFTKLRPKSEFHTDAMSMNFNDFIEYLGENRPMASQSSLVLEADGKPAVSFIGRFENLDSDFQTVCSALGCNATLRHKNGTKPKDFRSVYSSNSVDSVARLFADDVRNFGYIFE